MATAALAFAPLGFLCGAALALHLRTGQAEIAFVGADAMLGHGAFGALAAALTAAGAAAMLPRKPVRLATLVAGGASFAVVLFLVANFVAGRLAATKAAEAAYATMPAFELTLAAGEPGRAPFSTLTFRSDGREYVAERPGGWRCRGPASREHAVHLYTALTAVERPSGACERQASWRTAGSDARHVCLGELDALLDAADAMVDATERKASCRRWNASNEEPERR